MTSTTVALITQHQQGSVNHLQKARYCRICFRKGHQAEQCAVVAVQVRLTLFQQRDDNMDNILYKELCYAMRKAILLLH